MSGIQKALATGLLMSALACGKPSLDKQIERHPARVLPRGASQVLYARVDRLANNPLAVIGFEALGNMDWGRSMKGIAQTLRLAGTIERAAIGIYGSFMEDQPSAVLVAIGQFDEKKFTERLEEENIPHVREARNGAATYTCGRGDERCYVGFPSMGLLIAASRESLVNEVQAISRGKGKRLIDDKTFPGAEAVQPGLLRTFSPDNDIWTAGRIPPGLIAPLAQDPRSPLLVLRNFSLELEAPGALNSLLTVYSSFDEVNTENESIVEEITNANAKLLSKIVGSLATQFRMAGYEIDPLLAAVNRSKIEPHEGGAIAFSFSMTEEEVAATANAIKAGPSASPPSLLDQLMPTPGGALPPTGTPVPPRSP